MKRIIRLIEKAFNNFNIKLYNKILLTEAATGNYICTPILAALAGAKVYALAKETKYGTIKQIRDEIFSIGKMLNVDNKISIINCLDEIILGEIDIVTNTGFIRPINKLFIDKLKKDCVIPLMWEPWEHRLEELDLEAAVNRGIKVYGTNESDPRLQSMFYIGLTVIYFLLKEKKSPYSSKILIIGCKKFNEAIITILKKLDYSVISFLTEEYKDVDISDYDTIVIAEHTNSKIIIGNTSEALIQNSSLAKDQLIIHISGNVDFNTLTSSHYPDKPASFGYMSYTTDFIDPKAVIDLHAAGLKVAEGMIQAKLKGLQGKKFKAFMEKYYPALAFKDKKYW